MIDEKNIEKTKQLLDELDIPQLYCDFPKNFQVHVLGWSFSDDKEKTTIDVSLSKNEIDELRRNGVIYKLKHVNGDVYRIKRLRTLDIEIASDEAVDKMNQLKTLYEAGEFKKLDGTTDIDELKMAFARLYRDTCTQRCPHCFNQEDDFYVSRIINGQKLMKWNETFDLLKQAKRFGLDSVKFLGIGEIFKNPDLFKILDDLKRENIILAIFTKGAVLGDDDMARSCGYEGVQCAEDLVRMLSEYKNVSILLGGNSFDPKYQDVMVGCGKDGGVDNTTPTVALFSG